MPKGLSQFAITLTLAVAACGPGSAPSGVTLTPEAATTLDDLAVTVGSSSSLSGYRVEWYVNGTRRVDLIDEPVIPAALTSKGQEWTVSVAELSGTTPGEFAEVATVIANTPPTATVEIQPEAPKTGDPIRTVSTRRDIDTGTVGARFEWRKDGTLVDFTGNTLPAELTSSGDVWEVSVIPFDDEGDGEPATASVMVVNTPPRASRAYIDPARPTGADTLECFGDGWRDDDGDAPGYDVEWLHDGEVVGTGPTLAASELDRGDTVQCRATPNDGTDLGAPVTSLGVEILNALPTIASVSINPDPPTKLEPLTATIDGLVDFDDDPITFIYTWSVNGRAVSDAETLEPRLFTRDDTVSLTIVPNDGFGNGPPTTSPTLTVANTPPTISALVLSTEEPYTDSVILATAKAADLDRDPVTISMEWFVNGVSVGTGDRLDGDTYFDKGDEVYVEVTPDDGAPGVVETSSVLTVLNTPPTAPVLSTSPADVGAGDSVTCVVEEDSYDEDGDTVSYTLAWTQNGTTYSGGSTTTIPGDTLGTGVTGEGELWLCAVTPNDGDEDGEAGTTKLMFRTGPFEFTNCAAKGPTGPTQTACDTAYSGTELESVPVVTDGIQQFTVGISGTYKVEVWGAQAGYQTYWTYGYEGGYGAYMSGEFDLSAGDTLAIIVGQQGTSDTYGGGGGGGSFVLDDSGSALIVAGGGAGGGYYTSYYLYQDGCDAGTSTYGGRAGNSSSGSHSCPLLTSGLTTGGSGYYYGSGGGGMTSNGGDDYYSYGYGGKSVANGANGGTCSSYKEDGGFGGGGCGGYIGGGGGGGYSGGEGSYHGGAGGSYNSGANQSNSAGARAGHGKVTITKVD